MPKMAEFFSGAGMVRAALGDTWQIAFANDIDPKKCAAYAANWGREHLIEGDIAGLDPRLVQQPIDLFWASSPCQDLSLAGNRLGFSGQRSSVFHAWMDHVATARASGHAPRILAFENVTGLLSSRNGQDFRDVATAFKAQGYRFGALEIDARHFLPQSRPRIFVLAIRDDIAVPAALCSTKPTSMFHSNRVVKAAGQLPVSVQKNWIWWTPVPPAVCTTPLLDLIDLKQKFTDLKVDTKHLLSLMTEVNLAKVRHAQSAGGVQIGTIYKRGRPDHNGTVRQRAEVRFDGLSGCLRTPSGGSSRQTLMIVKDGAITTRLLSPREAARLMGLSDTYILPDGYNDAYKLSGDGVAVPVVKYLNDTLFLPLLAVKSLRSAA